MWKTCTVVDLNFGNPSSSRRAPGGPCPVLARPDHAACSAGYHWSSIGRASAIGGPCCDKDLVWWFAPLWKIWKSIAGWWFQTLWKILVSWDDYPQYMEKSKMFQTINQIGMMTFPNGQICHPCSSHRHHQPVVFQWRFQSAMEAIWNVLNPLSLRTFEATAHHVPRKSCRTRGCAAVMGHGSWRGVIAMVFVGSQNLLVGDCLVKRVDQHKIYLIATCDRDLKERIRKIPGIPIVLWFQPIWKIWVRQLGWWHSQYMGK